MPPAPHFTPVAALLLLVLALLWSGSFFLAEIALTALPPLTITLFRVALAMLVLLLVLRWQGLRLPRGVRVWRAYLVMGALNNALPFSLIFWGQTQIESGLAAILNATTAFFGAAVGGLLLPDEPLQARKIAGALLGLAGVAVIMGPDLLQGFDPRDLAQLAVLGAALSYAFAGVWGKTRLAAYPPQVNAAGMLIGATALMLPLVLLVEGPPSFALPLQVWAALLGLAIFATALAFMLYFAMLKRVGVANVMLVTLLVPPFAVTLGALFLDESLSGGAFAGFGLIGMGLLVTDGRWLRTVKRRDG